MKATRVNAGLAESNGRLLLGIWHDSLHVACGLTACTPGSAPGPTLGNEYGKTVLFTFYLLTYLLTGVDVEQRRRLSHGAKLAKSTAFVDITSAATAALPRSGE